MRFLYFALVMKPKANEMYMQRKYFYLYYTLFFHQNFMNMGSYLLIMKKLGATGQTPPKMTTLI